MRRQSDTLSRDKAALLLRQGKSWPQYHVITVIAYALMELNNQVFSTCFIKSIHLTSGFFTTIISPSLSHTHFKTLSYISIFLWLCMWYQLYLQHFHNLLNSQSPFYSSLCKHELPSYIETLTKHIS